MLHLPIQTYLMILVGLVTQDQEEVIVYLQAKNKVLRDQLDIALNGRRMRFTKPVSACSDDRRRAVRRGRR